MRKTHGRLKMTFHASPRKMTFYVPVHPNHGEPGSFAPRMYKTRGRAIAALKQVGFNVDDFELRRVVLTIPQGRRT